MAMKGVIEFIGYFISKTGRKTFEMNFMENSATVRDLLNEAEKAMVNLDFKVIGDGELKKGILLFYRKENGGTERVFELDTLLSETGGNIIMVTLMGGG
jgi:hypothetical protein